MLLLLLPALLVPRVQLALENVALRQQVAVLRRSVHRPRVRVRDRLFWVFLRRLWAGWRDALALVQPATVVRWHRAGWQLMWRWRSRKKSGRPPVPLEVRELIRRLSRENRLWGAPRIRDELRLLGHHVAKSTVEKYMVRRRGPPSPTWRAFLREHASEILACDFFTIPTASFRSLTGFVVMELGRRRILACGVTTYPSGSWAAEIVRRAATYEKCRYLMRDRDPVYGGLFSDAARSIGLRQMVSAPRTPVMNPYAERVIGTLRRECLDHVIVLAQATPSGSSVSSPTTTTPSARTRLSTANGPCANCALSAKAPSWPNRTSADYTTATAEPPETESRRPLRQERRGRGLP